MNVKTGNELKEHIDLNIKGKYIRKYVDLFFNKINHKKFSYIFYGLRRIGKTTMCFQILNKFFESNKYNIEKIAFLDIELDLSLGITSQEIKQTIFELFKSKKIDVIFFDEVQLLENWDMFIKSLNDHFPQIKIFCSGSSSYNLKEKESGIGRFVKINIQPLTLNEFMILRKKDIKNFSKKEVVDFYINETPFFEVWTISEADSKKRYMINILEKTIINDLSLIANRSFNSHYMKQIIREIALSETGELNFDKLRTKLSIPKTTFYEYLNIMQNIGIINILERYNGNLILSKRGPNKYYLSLPFFYKLYLDNNQVFHQGKIYESLFLMHLNYKYNLENLNRKIFYIRESEEIDFYIPDENIGYELKSNNIKFNDLYLKLSSLNKIELKTLDIDDLFDFIKEF